MIFALLDYICYRNGWTRYRPENSRGIFRFAFRDALPDAIIDALRPGDMVLLGSANSFLSWLVMYFTDSPVSHIALCAKKGGIVHATLTGVVSERLTSLHGKNNLLIPVIAPLTNDQRRDFVRLTSPLIGRPYSWRDIRRKAWWRLTGRDWYNFRWRYAADVSLALVIIGESMVPVCGTAVVNSAVPLAVYALLISVNYIRWRMCPLSLEQTGSPVDLLMIARPAGFRFILNAGAAYASGDSGAISTDLYVFLNRDNLPSIEEWRSEILKSAERVNLNVSVIPGNVGTANLNDVIVHISVTDADKETQRLGIKLDGFDICVRFDSSDVDPRSIIASVKATAALAVVAEGILYNPVAEHSLINSSQALDWSRRSVLALEKYQLPNVQNE